MFSVKIKKMKVIINAERSAFFEISSDSKWIIDFYNTIYQIRLLTLVIFRKDYFLMIYLHFKN
jgi:hypothetical protein